MAGLSIEDLRLTTAAGHVVLDDVSLAVAPGEVVAVVGESGAGKTALARAAVGHVRAGLVRAGGSVRVGDVAPSNPVRRRRGDVRRSRVGLVPQHPLAGLDPRRTIGAQLDALRRAHRLPVHRPDGVDRLRSVADAVALDPALLARYPHEVSGGQLQRAALAMSLVADPAVLVLDEPTTGLDVATRDRVLATVRRLCTDTGLAVLVVTHDLSVATATADRLAVVYAGVVVEEGPTSSVLGDAAHPYTRHLLAAVPDPTGGRTAIGLPGRSPDVADRPPGCPFAPRCTLAGPPCEAPVPTRTIEGDRSVRCVHPFAVPVALVDRPVGPTTVTPPAGALLTLQRVTASHRGTEVVRAASLTVAPGEWLALVGPSGAGKTTLLRTIAGLHDERRGRIALDGVPLARSVHDRPVQQRQAIQVVPQHPDTAFNPRRTIGRSVGRPLRLLGASASAVRDGTDQVLERVGLDPVVADRHPDELSGGELQRAAIARAVVGAPRLLLCDEVTSSVDPVVQAGLLTLLRELRDHLGLAIVLVTHDLPLAASADRTVALRDGQVVEVAPTGRRPAAPQHPGIREPLGATGTDGRPQR